MTDPRKTAYVAAAFADWREARRVQDALRARGYTIDDDWTQDAEQIGSLEREHKSLMTHEQQREIADEHLKAAMFCKLLVLVCGPTFADSIGAVGEFFLATAAGVPRHVISPPCNSVFFHLDGCAVFESFEQWEAAL